jgi:hypothetical protein
MKILRVNADQSELVEFPANDPQPGSAAFTDDGFLYQATTTPTQFTRRLRPPRAADASTGPVVTAVEQLLTASPALTVGDLVTQAHTALDAQHGPALVGQALGVVTDHHYQRAIRFADAPAQLVPKGRGPYQPWPQAFANDVIRENVFERAALHVDGKGLDDTPFVSVARSEGQLLQNAEVSLCKVIYGSDATGQHRQAQRIFNLVIPRAALITPEMLVQGHYVSQAVADMTTKETEALFYGFGVDRYVVSSRPNPYVRGDQDVLQTTAALLAEQVQLEQEETVRQATMAQAPPVSRLDGALASKRWTDFAALIRPFLQANKAAVAARCGFNLDGDDGQSLFGQTRRNRMVVLGGLDEALSADAQLGTQWTTLIRDYRT